VYTDPGVLSVGRQPDPDDDPDDLAPLLVAGTDLAVRAGIDVRLWEDVIQPFPAFSEVFGPALRDLVGELRGGEQTTGEQTTGEQTTGEQTTGELSRRLPAAVTAAGASQAS
jgi:hypothetical protein